MGRLGLTPREWGEMTLSEFSDAVEGFGELEGERLRWQLFNTRKICYYAIKPHLKEGSDFKEEDLIPIPELDEQIKKSRMAGLEVNKVIVDE